MEKYSIIKRLGAGGFGVVSLAERKEDKKQVVVKERVQNFGTNILLDSFRSFLQCIKVSGLDEKRREKVFEEFRLLSCLRDIHIVR